MEKKSVDFFLIGTALADFPKGKLPQHGEVLKVFMNQHFILRKTVKDSGIITAKMLMNSWAEETPNTPVIKDCHIVTKIKDFFCEWQRLSNHKDRNSPSQDKNKQKFLEKLPTIFSISKKAGKTDGLGNGPIKKKIPQKTVPTSDKPSNFEEIRREKIHGIERTKTQLRTEKLYASYSSDTDYEEEYEGDLPRKKICKENILSAELTKSFDLTGMSSNDASKVTIAIIQKLDQNPKDFTISKSSIHRKREQNRQELTKSIKDSFAPDSRLTLHWDGKKVQDLIGNTKVERVAIIVTGVITNKILEIPKIDKGTAQITANTIYNVITEWEVRDNVKALSFDTTAVNTGSHNGICKRLEQMLGREMLLLACRHHIMELLLESVWASHFGPSNGPDLALCNRFQQCWTKIDKTKFSSVIGDERHTIAIGDDIDEIICFAKDQIQIKHPRDDYLELLNLTIIFLGGVPPQGIKFQTPGNVSRARWMARAIYALKIWMFRHQFKLTQQEETGLLFFCMFVAKIYIKYWFQATDPIGSCKNDLDLIQDLDTWKSFDFAGSSEALNKMKRHDWYLRENMIALSLFDNRVPVETKIKALKNMQDKEKARNLLTFRSESIDEMFTEKSKDFFKILGLKSSFLSSHPSTWDMNSDYMEAKETVLALRVVNDVSERAISLMSNMNRTMTRKEDEFQSLIQIRSSNSN